MATLLDVTLLEGFQGIIVFIFIWVVVYGILAWREPFGDGKKGLYAFIALSLALLSLFSQAVVALILTIGPWFVVMAIFVFLMLMLLSTIGYDSSHIKATLEGENWKQTIVVWVIIISVIILLGGFGAVFFSPGGANAGTEGAQSTGDAELQSGNVGGTGAASFFATLVHPKVLGMIMILMIAFLTIQFLGTGSSPAKK